MRPARESVRVANVLFSETRKSARIGGEEEIEAENQTADAYSDSLGEGPCLGAAELVSSRPQVLDQHLQFAPAQSEKCDLTVVKHPRDPLIFLHEARKVVRTFH
jgi:hypothetical protein